MTETTKLAGSDTTTNDFFGYSVSISGDYAVVGAHGDDDGTISCTGSAYIFKRSGENWSEQAKLTASNRTKEDYFGRSVSISGDYVVVGAHYDDDGGTNSGSAYIFEKPGAGWAGNLTETAKLTAFDPKAHDHFGHSVSISDDCAIVGAYQDDDGGSKSGSAYIFEKSDSGWASMTETAKLTASDAALWDEFGYSVSISGDCAVVGAYKNADAGYDSGSAYIFEKPVSGWETMTETDKLTADDAAGSDQFGISVSIDDGYALIGSHCDDDNSANASGSAYVYTPEPATMSLLLLGTVALLRRRRK